MSGINTDDVHLKSTYEHFGGASMSMLGKIKELVDQYVAMPFNTRKADADQIGKSFDLLYRIYTTTLNASREDSLPAIQYLVRRIADERLGAFNPIRTNMMPNVEKGGSKTMLRFVADVNQLFANLATSNNANELRSRIRLDPILANVRSSSQRENIRQYIASIDT